MIKVFITGNSTRGMYAGANEQESACALCLHTHIHLVCCWLMKCMSANIHP